MGATGSTFDFGPIPFLEPRPDTPAEAAARRAAHERLCGHYQRLSALFHQLMVECRAEPEDGCYPYDSVVYFAENSSDLADLARSELRQCLK